MDRLFSHLVPAAAAAGSRIAVMVWWLAATALIGCQVPQRQALIQPACILLCQADQPVIDLGDRSELPAVAPVPQLRRK